MIRKSIHRTLLTFALAFFSFSAFAALNVAVEVSSSPAAPGELLMVRITVTNPGSVPANGVRLEMPYRTGLASLNVRALSDGGNCVHTQGDTFSCNATETAFWNLGTLAAGTGKTVYFTPNVGSAITNGTNIVFEAVAFEGAVQRDQASQTVLVDSGRILTLAVSPLQHPVAPASTVSFELVFGNRGTVASANTTLRFPIPSNTSFVSATDGGTLTGNEVVWNVGLMGLGTHDRRRVTLQLGGGAVAGSIIKVDAASVSGEANFNAQSARAASAVRVESGPSLDFAIVTSNDHVRPDEFLQTHLTVTNRSASAMANVRINMFYPVGLGILYNPALSDLGSCNQIQGASSYCASGDTAFWNLGTLAPGAGKTISLTPQTRTENVNGMLIPLIARAFADGVSDRWERRTLAADNGRVLSLAVNADQDPVPAAGRVIYDIAFSHRGTVATTDTTLRFPIPANTSFVSATGGGALVANEVVWTIGILNPGTHDRRRVTVQLGSGAVPGSVIEVESASISGEENFIAQTARAGSAIRVETGPDVDFAIMTSNDPVRPDEFLQTQLTVTNRAGSPMTNVRVHLFYPEGLNILYNGALTDAGLCNQVEGASSYCASGDTVIWNIGTLGARTGKTVSLTPATRSTNANGRLIPLVAKVFSDGVRDRWERRTLVVENGRMLSLAVNADQDPVPASGRVTYELAFSHRGSVATTNSTLRFPIPPNTSFVSATGGGTLIANEVVWNIGLVNPGIYDRRAVTVQLGAGALNGSMIEVDAASISGDANFIAQAARANSNVRVETGPPLELAIVSSNDPVRSDEYLQTHLTVTNRSAAPMTNVRINMFYPEGLGILYNPAFSDSVGCNQIGGGSTYCGSGDTASWNLGTLPPGTGKTISFTPETRSTNPNGMLIPLIARAFADSVRDRWERRTLVVSNTRPLSLAVDADAEPRIGGPDLTYTLTFGNRGATGATNSVLRFPIPAGLTVISADGAGVISANEVTWNIGLLGPGQGSRRQVLVRANANLTAGALIEVSGASLSSSTVATVRAGLVQRLKPNNELDFFANFNPVVLSQGGMFSVNLQVQNRSGVEMTGVTPTLFYPDSLFNTNVSSITEGGFCNQISGGSSFCASGDTVIWNLGNLAASGSRTVTIMPTVRSGSGAPPNGTVIPFFARAQNASIDRVFLTRSLFVGTFLPIPPTSDQIFRSGFELPQ